MATAAYLKHLGLAQEAVSAKQLFRADELLERCEPGLRDWEWHYLQRRTHRWLHTLRGHAQVLRGGAAGLQNRDLLPGVLRRIGPDVPAEQVIPGQARRRRGQDRAPGIDRARSRAR